MNPPPGIRVDPHSPIPPYEQVRQQIADLITSGTLAAGMRLPPVRQLAADLGLAIGTVGRSYQELESTGLVITHRGGGTRVAQTTPLTTHARAGKLAGYARDYVAAAKRIGASETEFMAAVQTASSLSAKTATTNSDGN